MDAVLEIARRLLRVHPLRAADSLQLAAAFLASEGKPSTLEFVCLDDRLVIAAQREGFPVRDRSRLKRAALPPERPGDLFVKVFGPDNGVDLDLPPREPHEPEDPE